MHISFNKVAAQCPESSPGLKSRHFKALLRFHLEIWNEMILSGPLGATSDMMDESVVITEGNLIINSVC